MRIKIEGQKLKITGNTKIREQKEVDRLFPLSMCFQQNKGRELKTGISNARNWWRFIYNYFNFDWSQKLKTINKNKLN